jgi:glycine/D-amino acid oxidase-like deaminating enzyme
MTVSYWQDDGREGALREVDVLIVGGGIAGWSTAYWLEPSGMSIAVVDQGDLCHGASGKNAGFVTCGSVEHYDRQVKRHGAETAHALWRYAQENLELIRSQIVDKGHPCDFVQRGTYSLAGTDHELTELAASAALMTARGIRVEMVDARHIHTELGARGFPGGALYHDDGEVHPVKLCRAIASESRATFYPYHEVFGFDLADDGAVLVRTGRCRFRASCLVLATNGYSANLHPWFLDKIYPTRGQILVTEPVAPFLRAPCYANFVLDYFRQLPDGHVLIGGFRQLAKETEVGTADVINQAIDQALLEFLARHFERLEGKRVLYRWSGVMGFSVDGVPLIGSLPGMPNVYFVGGFTAHGIGLGFKAGQLMARLILHGETPAHLSARRLR